MATTAIDITKRGIRGKCDLKCAYTFKYPVSSSTLTNRGIYLALSYDATTMAPVTYNAEPYTVSQIHIYSPSLHLFNGEKVAGEMVIIHAPQKGGDYVYVAIPLVTQGGSTGTGASIISQIISRASGSTPSDGDNVALNISGFTLDDIIPSRLPYISYTGNNMNNDFMSPWIVFGRENGINISTSDASTLGGIIKEFDFGATGEQLYLNEAGANSLASDQTGEVYISCEPTNTSEEQVEVTTSNSSNTTHFNWGDMFKGGAWGNVIRVLIIVAIVLGGFFTVNYLWRITIGKSGNVVQQTGGGNRHVRFAHPLSRSTRR